ncbi:MAG: hypothetical protein JHC33_13215 [Ignisphaera sp.]|nr:hypothetical protein [Ignisphaera sp.]
MSRSFFDQVREEAESVSRDSMQRLRAWVNRLYGMLLSILSDPQLRASVERLAQKMCRDVSMRVLNADVVPEHFPLKIDELVQKVFTAVHRIVSDPEHLKQLVEQGAVEPTTDAVREYAMRVSYEILGACLEATLVRVGVTI